MKNTKSSCFKHYIRCQLLSTRVALGLTQTEMSERLHISTRAYTKLESGRNSLPTETFVRFLCDCCPDKDAFLNGLHTVLHSDESLPIV